MNININGHTHKTGIPRVYTINTDYTIGELMGYCVFLVDTTLVDVTITIPSPVPPLGGSNIDCFVIKKISELNRISILPTSSTIDGSSIFTIYRQYESITLVSDGSNWHVT
jgi:hypothetical protein